MSGRGASGVRAAALVLMGLRGSGKSTIGRLVAQRTGAEFIDLDHVTTGLLGGGSLPELWARFGEARFREAEVEALRGLRLDQHPARRVVALGGGTPTAPGASEILESASRAGRIALVYLRAQPQTLRARLDATDIASRPSLTGAGTLEEIESVFGARDPLYRGLAALVVQTDGRSVEDVAAELSGLT